MKKGGPRFQEDVARNWKLVEALEPCNDGDRPDRDEAVFCAVEGRLTVDLR